MAHTTVSWTLLPDTLVEEQYSVTLDDYEINVSAGEIAIKLPHMPAGIPAGQLLQLRAVAEAHAAAAAISRGVGWRIEGPTIAHVADDGSRTVQLSFGVSAVLAVGALDTLVAGADGTVVHDSRRARIDRQRELAALLFDAQMADPLCAHLVESLQRARQRADYELLHLYEIRDALSKRFGGDKKARRKLGITKGDWSFLGRLANKEPLEGSRHRGEHLVTGDPLPTPTPEQLDRARSIAVGMIEAYARGVVAA
jgi:hypothetical protein